MRLRIAAFALALLTGLGMVGIVSADESGNWFTRLFTPTNAKTEAAKAAAKSDMPPVQTSYAKRARRALADLERRQEVCLKLRDIANTNGDEETLRQVEQLERRAFDLCQSAKNAPEETAPISVEKKAKKGGR